MQQHIAAYQKIPYTDGSKQKTCQYIIYHPAGEHAPLRKTGSTLIEQIDPLATELYLAHAEPGMKKHYAQRDWGRLEKALLEMEKRLKGIIW